MAETSDEFEFKKLSCGYVMYQQEDQILGVYGNIRAERDEAKSRAARLEEALRSIAANDGGTFAAGPPSHRRRRKREQHLRRS